jgi:predicted N-acetyltransferase YhbS
MYMCGSIPKGTAIPDKSDADFTFVLHSPPSEQQTGKLEDLKISLLESHPFITKIDTPLCLVTDVINSPFDWGFWVKIICICVMGSDLGVELPDYVPSAKLVWGLNKDTEAEVRALLIDIDKSPSLFTRRKLAKRVLRAIYTLTMNREKQWEDDFVRIFEICSVYFPQWKDSLSIVADVISGIDAQNQLFIEHAEKLFRFVMIQSSLSISSIHENREYIPLVSEWIFEEFINDKIPGLSLKDITDAVRSRQLNLLPVTYIAKAGSECIGTVSLFKHDLRERPGLSPWLGALYVDEHWRGFGAGLKLIEFIQVKASELGYVRLYLRTETTAVYYERLNWNTREQLIDRYGQNVTVFQKSIGETVVQC